MAKIKITTLTDKIKDEEILSRLKGIGVKIKDKEKEKEEQAWPRRRSLRRLGRDRHRKKSGLNRYQKKGADSTPPR